MKEAMERLRNAPNLSPEEMTEWLQNTIARIGFHGGEVGIDTAGERLPINIDAANIKVKLEDIMGQVLGDEDDDDENQPEMK